MSEKLTLKDFGGSLSGGTITFSIYEMNELLKANGLPIWNNPKDRIEPFLWMLLRLFYSTQIDFTQVQNILFSEEQLAKQSNTLRVSRSSASGTPGTAIAARELYTLQFNFVGAEPLTDPDLL
ncbi:hypothetical protein [Picosynechococcus sp. NKBG15041c]|uniref:hypothetical protein n=1 Tax=Picosynechococcus sp. NKBG15041c TaxID=1407650 RepID=UPI00041AB411|nr:hypothetical protein [Picosynechococcus sp. NKBG15041c]